MGKNKTGKYFKYAIGEIILVVIGILIALGINNWNNRKNDKKREKDALTEIYLALESDFEQLINMNFSSVFVLVVLMVN